MAPTLTILAPTHDRPEVLARVWPSWINQEGVTEIIIVDDGSQKDYTDVFREIRNACDGRGIAFKPVRLPRRRGAPAAKNAGLKLCTAQEILTTDDDIVLPPEMVAICRRQRPQQSNPTIVGPRVIYVKDGETEQEALEKSNLEAGDYFNFSTLTLTAWANPGSPTQYPFITAVALWPAELFLQGLEYFEGYGGNGYREESDPQLSASTNYGAAIYLTPAAHCFHLPPSIAYAKKGGQRRGGFLWFELWVLVNNAIFLWRFRNILRSKFNINPVLSWLNLTKSRFSLERLLRLLKRL